MVASYLAGKTIPDLNSGLRVLRRSVLQRFLPLLPAGFSFTATITLSLLCTNHRVVYEPIGYRARIGTSKVQAFHFASFVLLVLRTVVLFNPLRVFLPLALLLFMGGMAWLVADVIAWTMPIMPVLWLLGALLVSSVGLLADMVGRLLLHWQR